VRPDKLRPDKQRAPVGEQGHVKSTHGTAALAHNDTAHCITSPPERLPWALRPPKSKSIFRVSWIRPTWGSGGGGSRLYLRRYEAERLARTLRDSGAHVAICRGEVATWAPAWIEDEW
jgi:hypothetical protein